MHNVAFLVVLFVVAWLVAAFTDLGHGDAARGFIGWREVDASTGEAFLSPGPATSYRIVGDRIVSNTGGFVAESVGCTIFDVRNWDCPFPDGSGGHAMNDGLYVIWPNDTMVGVSQFEWHILECQEAAALASLLDAALVCIFGPFLN
jgi:hypothetical protein